MAVTAVVIPQADAATRQTLYTSAATTLSGSLGPFPVDFFASASISVVVTTCSGTLDVYVQKRLADNVTYDDIAHFTQWTTGTTSTRTLSFVNGGNTLNSQGSGALAANTVLTVHFGGYWQILFAIGGTGGTSTFGVYGDFRS